MTDVNEALQLGNLPPKTAKTAQTASPLQSKIAARVNAQIEKALKPAEVILTVNPSKFRNIFRVKGSGKSRNTVAKMKMTIKHHPRVQIYPKFPDSLVIRPKGATIRFTIQPRNQYSPIGIAFNKIKGRPHRKQRDRIGSLNFQTSQMPRDRHTLLITDSFKDKEQDDHYKFSVIIQRMKDGAIGIIDPDIIHEH